MDLVLTNREMRDLRTVFDMADRALQDLEWREGRGSPDIQQARVIFNRAYAALDKIDTLRRRNADADRTC